MNNTIAYTDLILFFISILFLIRGASRGFLNSLVGPFSIILTTILSIIYYQQTNDVITSLLIGLIGPMLLYFIIKLLLRSWTLATNSGISQPNFLSRLAGALLTLAWGWIFIVFTLILLAVMPPWGKALTAVNQDVLRSRTYRVIKPLGECFFTAPKKNVPATPSASTTASDDAKSLAQDPRFQAVLQDPEIKKDIDAHDLVKLMSNPKMMDLTRQIMSDPATMKKVMALYSHQTASQSIFASSDSSN